MPRPFVVIGKSATVMANLNDCFFEIDELVGTVFRYRPFFSAHGVTRPTGSKNRIKRILCEHVLDVGDQQFLVLLLMMKTENEYRFNLIEQLFVRSGKEIVNMRID